MADVVRCLTSKKILKWIFFCNCQLPGSIISFKTNQVNFNSFRRKGPWSSHNSSIIDKSIYTVLKFQKILFIKSHQISRKGKIQIISNYLSFFKVIYKVPDWLLRPKITRPTINEPKMNGKFTFSRKSSCKYISTKSRKFGLTEVPNSLL